MNNTTRRFPRSCAEAFPAERFAAVEHYRAPSRLVLIVCVVVSAIGLIGMVVL